MPFCPTDLCETCYCCTVLACRPDESKCHKLETTMTDKVTHEAIEKWVEQQPLDTMQPLPDCTESREARRLIREASKLAHQVVERVEADR